jgi:hypothetical protein
LKETICDHCIAKFTASHGADVSTCLAETPQEFVGSVGLCGPVVVLFDHMARNTQDGGCDTWVGRIGQWCGGAGRMPEAMRTKAFAERQLGLPLDHVTILVGGHLLTVLVQPEPVMALLPQQLATLNRYVAVDCGAEPGRRMVFETAASFDVFLLEYDAIGIAGRPSLTATKCMDPKAPPLVGSPGGQGPLADFRAAP